MVDDIGKHTCQMHTVFQLANSHIQLQSPRLFCRNHNLYTIKAHFHKYITQLLQNIMMRTGKIYE